MKLIKHFGKLLYFIALLYKKLLIAILYRKNTAIHSNNFSNNALVYLYLFWTTTILIILNNASPNIRSHVMTVQHTATFDHPNGYCGFKLECHLNKGARWLCSIPCWFRNGWLYEEWNGGEITMLTLQSPRLTVCRLYHCCYRTYSL